MDTGETVADAKKILDKHALGTAHNKVIHLISLYEGITISTLLRKLKVTKAKFEQSFKRFSKNKGNSIF